MCSNSSVLTFIPTEFLFLATTLNNVYPKGRPKDIFVHLMFDVVKFCRACEFDTEKSAATMSQFYQTHIYFTSGLEVSAEKLYIYFKELMMCHSLPVKSLLSHFNRLSYW